MVRVIVFVGVGTAAAVDCASPFDALERAIKHWGGSKIQESCWPGQLEQHMKLACKNTKEE